VPFFGIFHGYHGITTKNLWKSINTENILNIDTEKLDTNRGLSWECVSYGFHGISMDLHDFPTRKP